MRKKKFICDIREKKCKDTPYACTSDRDLKRHKACVHHIGVTWHICDKILTSGEKCGKKCKTKSNLDAHISIKHCESTFTYPCCFIYPDGKKCSFTTQYPDTIPDHQARIHGIGVVWIHCDEILPNGKKCEHKVTKPGKLTEHKQDAHNIGVKWKICTEIKDNGKVCNDKFKRTGQLKEHKANKHDIGVTWYKCTELITKDTPCPYKSKKNCHIKRHKETEHDIGAERCDFCFQNRNSHIPFTDKVGKHHICRECYNKSTGKSTRIEHIVSDYLDEKFGVEYLLLSDSPLSKENGCIPYRPDKLYTSPTISLHIEVDEHQHMYSNGSYKCDEKRMTEISAKCVGIKYVCIRWNPDTYKTPDGSPKLKRSERMKMLLDLMKKLTKYPPEPIESVYYMFYNQNSHRIAKNLPVTMIYKPEDIESIKPANERKIIRIKIKKKS